MSRAEELLGLYEALLHRQTSFRQGRRVITKTCGPGYRKVGNSCKRQSSSQRLHMRMGRIQAARKNRAHAGSIQRKRQRSLLRRASSGY